MIPVILGNFLITYRALFNSSKISSAKIPNQEKDFGKSSF